MDELTVSNPSSNFTTSTDKRGTWVLVLEDREICGSKLMENWGFWWRLSDDTLPTEVGVLEIDEDGKAEIGDGEVAQHLGEMGFVEDAYDFGIDDDEVVDDEIWD